MTECFDHTSSISAASQMMLKLSPIPPVGVTERLKERTRGMSGA